MKNRIRRVIAFLGVLSILLLMEAACTTSDKQAQAERMVEKIELFRAENKRLPESVEELGFEESEQGPVYYRKRNDEHYEVWYGTSLGESVTYLSDQKAWRRSN